VAGPKNMAGKDTERPARKGLAGKKIRHGRRTKRYGGKRYGAAGAKRFDAPADASHHVGHYYFSILGSTVPLEQ